MEEDKKSNRIGAGHGEGANSLRLRGNGGGGEEHSGRIGTRSDAHARSDTVNREHHGNSNSTRIAGGGKAGGKNNHGSDKHNSGKLVHGKGSHSNDDKDDSIRLKRPLDSDTLKSSTEIRHSGKILGGSTSDTALNGIIDLPSDGMDNRHTLSLRGNVTLESTNGGGGKTNGSHGNVGGGMDTSISVDTTLGMLVELDSMKSRLQGRTLKSGAGGAGGEVSRLETPSSLEDMMPDSSSPNPAINVFGYPIASNHAR